MGRERWRNRGEIAGLKRAKRKEEKDKDKKEKEVYRIKST